MTNEEAIALVRAKYNMHCDDTECNNDHCDACCEAFEMAIGALKLTAHHDKECMECKHLHCDTWCDRGETFERK